MKTIFTTGQVAKICKVAPRTVSKWFDSGRLRGHRIPGSQDRRIPRENLVRFLKEHGMPVGDLDDSEVRALIVSADEEVRNSLSADNLKVEFANDVFSAGGNVVSFKPHCVVIDCVGRLDSSLSIARSIRASENGKAIVLIALYSDKEAAAVTNGDGIFNDKFRKPFDKALLAERISTLVVKQKEEAEKSSRRLPKREAVTA